MAVVLHALQGLCSISVQHVTNVVQHRGEHQGIGGPGLLGKGSALQRMLQLSHVFTVPKVSLLRI